MSIDTYTKPAPDGQLYVCSACRRTSSTRSGFNEAGRSAADQGWDESCMMHAVLVDVASIERDARGRVVKATAVPKEQ